MDGTRIIAGSTPAQQHKPVDDATRQRLQRATKEFESLLIGYMLKSMRSSTNSSELFGDSYGGDVLDGLFDGQMAQHVSSNSSLGLAEMLYRRMTGEELPAKRTTAAHPAAAKPATEHHQEMKSRVNVPPPVQIPAPNAEAMHMAEKKTPVAAQPEPQSKPPLTSPVPVLSSNGPGPVLTAHADSTRAVPDTLRRRLDLVAPAIQEAADTHRVDPNLLKAIIAAESHGDASARSPKNAKGLMQLIDSTATAMGVKNVWNPRENVLGGAKYLSKLMEQFGGDREKAVASYNAGPGAVRKHGGIPPFKETRAYVDKVMNYMRLFEQQESGNGDSD